MWITTYTGRRFDLSNPERSSFRIMDVAGALAKLCRFCGHTAHFYSVAQHSVLLANRMEDDGFGRYDCYRGLMHDATEAFLGDVAHPLKCMLPDYRRIEKSTEEIVLGRFGIHVEARMAPVKEYDMRMQVTERRDLLVDQTTPWEGFEGLEPFDEVIVPWSPEVAMRNFVAEFYRLAPMKEAMMMGLP